MFEVVIFLIVLSLVTSWNVIFVQFAV